MLSLSFLGFFFAMQNNLITYIQSHHDDRIGHIITLYTGWDRCDRIKVVTG